MREQIFEISGKKIHQFLRISKIFLKNETISDDSAERKWVEEQVAVNKENVNERLAAMGAATAQVKNKFLKFN